MTIDLRIPTVPGLSTPVFHRPGQTLLAPSAKRREVFGGSHEGRAASCYELLVRRAFLHTDDSVEWIDEGGVISMAARRVSTFTMVGLQPPLREKDEEFFHRETNQTLVPEVRSPQNASAVVVNGL